MKKNKGVYSFMKNSLRNRAARLLNSTLGMVGYKISRKEPSNSFLGIKYLPIRTVIDVGANNGQFAQYITSLFPDAKIFCFEPNRDAFVELEKYTSKSSSEFTVYNCALGETPGLAPMHMHVDHTPSSSILETTNFGESLYEMMENQDTVEVEVKTLDEIFGDGASLDSLILLKLDVQGFEDRVLRGGETLLRKIDACLLEICSANLYDGQASFKDIYDILSGSGFEYYGNHDQTYGDKGELLFYDAVFIKPDLTRELHSGQ